jgi:hypothetical protein
MDISNTEFGSITDFIYKASHTCLSGQDFLGFAGESEEVLEKGRLG